MFVMFVRDLSPKTKQVKGKISGELSRVVVSGIVHILDNHQLLSQKVRLPVRVGCCCNLVSTVVSINFRVTGRLSLLLISEERSFLLSER